MRVVGAVIVGWPPHVARVYPCSSLGGANPQAGATATHIYTPVPEVGVAGILGLTGLNRVSQHTGFQDVPLEHGCTSGGDAGDSSELMLARSDRSTLHLTSSA